MFRFLGYSREVANLLTSLVTLDGSLPQGAPTSPDLANVAAYRLDVRLSAFAERHGLVYTRYADDLTFSGEQLRAPRVTRAIEHIVRAERFSPNDDKRRYVADHQRQTVTGLVVNDALNWPRERRRWLRQEVHFLARFGLSSHLERRGASRPAYRDFIYGHVYALNQANHREARRLLELLDSVDWT
jgi:retron-type reverse transcriptase